MRGGGRAEGQLLLLVAIQAGAGGRDARPPVGAGARACPRARLAAGRPIVDQFALYAELLVDVLEGEVEQTGSVHGCPFGNLVVELATRDDVVRGRAEQILSELRLMFATAITGAKDAKELPAELDADDLAEAILAHVEGLFVIAKARNDPAVFERLPRDVERLLASRA